MRGISSWLAIAAAIAPSALAQDIDAFSVTNPAAGDTVAIPDDGYGRATIEIFWTVPEAIAERPVRLSLMQGDSIEAMVEMELITSGAPNNGSYNYTSYLDNTAPSGCNYTILAKAWTSFSYSGYFTIINPEDSGLDTSSTCPVDVGRLKPAEDSYDVPANTGNSTAEDGGDGSAAESNTGGGSSGNGGGGGGGGGGVSTTTLAVAVAVPIVVLLVIFAVVIVIGRRRGWFIRKQDLVQHRGEQGTATSYTGMGDSKPGMQEQGKESDIRVGELHGHDRPHMSDGTPIHQLYGSEGR